MFWTNWQTKFHALASVVHKYFSVSTANNLVEKFYSSFKITSNERKTTLNMNRVNKLMGDRKVSAQHVHSLLIY